MKRSLMYFVIWKLSYKKGQFFYKGVLHTGTKVVIKRLFIYFENSVSGSKTNK